KITGLTLENLDGEKLGKIKDLIVTLPSGDVRYVVVTTGGLMGIAAHTKIVPAPAVSLATAKSRTASLDISLRRWKDAPQFRGKETDFRDHLGPSPKQKRLYVCNRARLAETQFQPFPSQHRLLGVGRGWTLQCQSLGFSRSDCDLSVHDPRCGQYRFERARSF